MRMEKTVIAQQRAKSTSADARAGWATRLKQAHSRVAAFAVALLVIFPLSTAALAQIALVQNIGVNTKTLVTNNNITVTVPPAGVALGNTIIISLRVGSFVGAIGCTDTKSNTYNTDLTDPASGAARLAVISAHVDVALVSGDVITCTYPQFSGLSLISANEFSGLAVSPFDQSAHNASSNAGAASSGLTPTTTQADELVFGVFQLGSAIQTITPETTGSNPAETYNAPPNSFPYTTVGGVSTMNPMYRIVSTARQYELNGTVVGSGGWRAVVVTYKGGIAPTANLTVTKVVDNTGGGTKVIGDFPLFVDAVAVTSGVQNTFSTGAHTVSETTDPNYTAVISGDCATNGAITLAANDVKACTITNTFIVAQANLTVTKVVDNTGGGTKVIGDFPLFVDTVAVTSGVQNMFGTGAHTVSETTDPTYTAVISGDCAADGTITLAANDVKACTITNTFNAPKLTVTKVVDNTGGGTKVIGDFPLFVDAVAVTSGVQNTFSTGAHTVSETTDPTYTAVISGDCATNGAITLAANDVKACTITNTFIVAQANLTVTKVVDNTGGGTKVVSDFPLFVDAVAVTSGVQNMFGTGAHTVSETTDPTYTAVISGDCAADGTITLAANDVKACTITNTFNAPMLTVTKVVVNTGGGTKVIGDFPLFVDAGAVSSGVQNTFSTGLHTVSETIDPTYTAVISGDCAANGQITLAAGDVKACTITNTFIAPKLTVTKVVVNTGGGTKVISDFPLFVDGGSVTSGVQNTFATGAHTVSETTDPTYTAVISGDCAANGSITLSANDVKACTITNTFNGPRLTVTKVVVNTGGGTKVIGDFPLFVDGGSVISGVQNTFSTGAHTVSETTDPTYTAVISGDCAANGSITLAAGEVKACTITNTFNPAQAKLTVTKVVVNTGGGTKVVGDFPLFVDGGSVISGVQNTFSAGAHTVSETTDPTYTAVISGDCAANGSITLATNDVKACTITNTFNPAQAKLTVTKVVVNTGGGTKVVGDFPLFVDGGSVISGVQNTFSAGAHTVSETTDPTYTAVISGDCAANGSITLATNDVKACTITNTFNPAQAKLTVTKVVVNTGGGTKVVADFPLKVDATTVVSGVQNTFGAGAHTVSETTDPAYTAAISGDCAANGSITLAANDVKACTITNTFNGTLATVTVNNVIVQPGDPGKFNLQIDGVTVEANAGNGGTTGAQSISAGVAHTIGVVAGVGTNLSDYTTTIDCGNGPVFATSITITPVAGTTTTCTITNLRNGVIVVAEAIPTLDAGLLAALGILLAMAGAWTVRRRESEARARKNWRA